METKTVKSQSMFDLAIQMGGSVETVFTLALKNELSVTSEILPGQTIESADVLDEQIADYYRVKNIRPATFSGQEILTLAGIRYMSIDENFIVS